MATTRTAAAEDLVHHRSSSSSSSSPSPPPPGLVQHSTSSSSQSQQHATASGQQDQALRQEQSPAAALVPPACQQRSAPPLPETTSSLVAYVPPVSSGGAVATLSLVAAGPHPGRAVRCKPTLNALLVEAALSEGQAFRVRGLVEAGADPNHLDPLTGMTALQAAAFRGQLATVDYLTTPHEAGQRGAQLEARDRLGYTPLALACEGGSLAVVQLLVDRGAKLSARQPGGSTLLHVAAVKGDVGVLRFLLGRGLRPDEASESGATPLYTAACRGHLEAVQLMVDQHGAAVNGGQQQDVSRWPIMGAAIQGKPQVVAYLLQRGALSSSSTGGGAKQRGQQQQANAGLLLLAEACVSGHVEVAKVLVQQGGVDPQARTLHGLTPLMLAAQEGQLQAVAWLVEGAGVALHTSVGLPGGSRRTAKQLALLAKHTAISDYLRAKVRRAGRQAGRGCGHGAGRQAGAQTDQTGETTVRPPSCGVIMGQS